MRHTLISSSEPWFIASNCPSQVGSCRDSRLPGDDSHCDGGHIV